MKDESKTISISGKVDNFKNPDLKETWKVYN